MASKTWKLGEVCKGGVITTKTKDSKVTIIGKIWDVSQGTHKGASQKNAKEFTRLEVDYNYPDADMKVDSFLCELTTAYHVDNIKKWIESKVKTTDNIMSW